MMPFETKCPRGGLHNWIFIGTNENKLRMYQCTKCGEMEFVSPNN